VGGVERKANQCMGQTGVYCTVLHKYFQPFEPIQQPCGWAVRSVRHRGIPGLHEAAVGWNFAYSLSQMPYRIAGISLSQRRCEGQKAGELMHGSNWCVRHAAA